MCLPATHQNRRIRTLICIGMFCLALSLGMQNFYLIGSGPRDFVRGLLIGISIALNLYAVVLGARLRRNGHA